MEIKSKTATILSFLTLSIRVVWLCFFTGTALLLGVLISSLIQDKMANSPTPSYFSLHQPPTYLPVMATDFIPLPPIRSEFFSQNKDYVFVLSTLDNWKSKQAVGALFQVTANTRQLLWNKPLPHEYGPRYVLVGNQGQVLLLDEWINVKSRYAVMILDRDNRLVAQHDFDTVQRILDIPVARVVEMARHGWWIASPPTLDASGEKARVAAAGKVLTIRFSDGYLSL